MFQQCTLTVTCRGREKLSTDTSIEQPLVKHVYEMPRLRRLVLQHYTRLTDSSTHSKQPERHRSWIKTVNRAQQSFPPASQPVPRIWCKRAGGKARNRCTDHSLKQWSAKLVKQQKAHLVSMPVIRRFWSCSLMLLKKTGWRPVEVSQVLSAVRSSRSLHSSKAVRSRQRLSRPHCPLENKSQMLLADGSVSVARSDCLIGHATCLCRASKQTVL